jgi:branched-chain amino acid transport system permease protein
MAILATLPVAGFVCFVSGLVRVAGTAIAWPLSRLATCAGRGDAAAARTRIEKWTGGVQGIVIQKPDPPFGLPLNPDQWLYYFTLAVMLVMFLLAWNLLRGRIGRAMIAIRDNHVATEAMGVNNAMVKSLTFGVSAMYTGIAGALGAIAIQFVAPDSFDIFLSIILLVGIVIGGLASISGAIYGALFIQFVPNIADQISKAAPWAIYGASCCVRLSYAHGVAGLVRLIGSKLPSQRLIRSQSRSGALLAPQ